MKKNILLLAVAFFLSSTCLPLPIVMASETAQTCPVSGDSVKNNKLSLDYQGSKYQFCCKSCMRKFKKNPSKYLKSNKPA